MCKLKPSLALVLIFILVSSTTTIRFASFFPFASSVAAQLGNSGIGDNAQGVVGRPSGPSSLSSLFDPSDIKIISSNETGYEAISPLDNDLVWHISMNSVPHVHYTPTQKDVERISATREPLYNVNVEKTITNDTVSVKASFFVPYNALSSTAASSSPHISHASFLASAEPSVPTAEDQSVTTNINMPIRITLNDSSPNPSTDLTASILIQPTHGTLSEINQQTGLVTYTPQSGYTGPDRFSFKVNDGKADSSNTGTISIFVGDNNSNPTASSPSPQSATMEANHQLLLLSSSASQVVPVADGSQSGGSQSQGETSSGNEGPLATANNVRGNIEGVIGVFHEYAEAVHSPILKLPIVESLLEKYDKWWDKLGSNIADAAYFGIEAYGAVKEITESEDCVKNSPIQFASEEARKTWENAMNTEKVDITANFMLQGANTILAKILTYPLGKVGIGKAAEVVLTKYGDSVFQDVTDHELAIIKQMSPCVKPVSAQEKENFQNCMLLMRKNLKTFAINSCINKAGTTPPLQQFTK